MLKIVQITDSHFLPEGRETFGISPYERLRAAIDDINRNHSDAALCVLTGDVAEDPSVSNYRDLRRLIERLRIPCKLLPGNHDEREALREAFPEIAAYDDDFLQSEVATPIGALLFLDTVDPGSHAGIYCDQRKFWLRSALERNADRPVFVFMHHPPFSVGITELDRYQIVNGEEMAEVFKGHRDIRHIFFGHIHRSMAGSWNGMPFSSVKSTCQQANLDMRTDAKNVCSLEPPSYAVALIDNNKTLVHFHDYMDMSPRYLYDPDTRGDRRFLKM